MSKRGADEYITKENGSTPNDITSDGSKVKMATAAQLAKRKMAVPKSRAGRTGLSPMPGAGPSNPFASTNTFGASQDSQQQNIGGGLFGASQSFPPGDSNSSTGFNFSVPGQSTSFTFGQTAPNNPFATLNGNANDHPKPSQDPNDTIMESPQKKPVFGSGMFGSTGNESTSQSTGFGFGQPSVASSQPSFSFGQSQGGLFGAKPTESTNTNNVFGQTVPSQNGTTSTTPLFGQNPAQPQQQLPSSGFSFGKTSTSTPASAPTFSFGQTSTSATSSAPAPSFGQATTQSGSSGLFGTTSQPSQPSFGQSLSSSQPGTNTPLFGSTSSGSTNNVFGGFGSQKPAEKMFSTEIPASAPTSSEQPKTSLFSQAPTPPSVTQDQSTPSSADKDPAKVNPFAGLFSSSAKQSETNKPGSGDAQKPVFNFAAPAQPSGLFGVPKDVKDDRTFKPVDEPVKKALFSFGTPAATPSSTLFSPEKSSVESPSSKASQPLFDFPTSGKSATEPPTSANPFAALAAKQSDSTESKSTQSSFDFLNKQPAPTDVQPTPFAGFGGFGSQTSAATTSSTTKPATNDQVLKNSTTPTPSFGNSTGPNSSEPPKSKTDVSGSSGKVSQVPSTVNSDSAAAKTKPVEPREASQRIVNTNPPSRIPPYLNGDDYKAYDSNYRLHSLNREFQKHIASLDPSRHDFENLVRNYVAARESIGESIGLYTRNIAGMKRKPDENQDEHIEDATSTKRTKQTNDATAKSTLSGSTISSSVFQPVSSTPKPSNTSTSSVAPSSNNQIASSASTLFSSMIPNNKSTPTVPSSSNPFANLAKPAVDAASSANTKPTFSFGTSTTTPVPAGSTTPTKSPPKKPVFEMPQFTAPASTVNFMDAFKKKSEASAAKFAKEAKEKRKAEDFDSDEDDEEEWERKYEEEQRAKKAKVEAVAQKGFIPSFGNSISSTPKPTFTFGTTSSSSSTQPKPTSGFSFGGQEAPKSSSTPIEIVDISGDDASGEEETEDNEESGDAENDGEDDEEEGEDDDLPEDDVNGDDDQEDEEEDFEAILAKSRNKGKSLFERVTPNPTLQKTSSPASSAVPSIEKEAIKKPSVFGNPFSKGTPDAPSFSPLTPVSTKEPYVPSKTFNFTPTANIASPTPMPGASIFAGGVVKDGPITGEGLFGSRPSTPSNADTSKPLFNFGTPSATSGSDHTWKKGSEIKFGSSTTEPPSVSITEPTPRKDESKPFANLFGPNSTSASKSSFNNGIGFSFSQPAPGYLSAASHLTGESGTTSGISSRATSPGTTDNESVATNEEDYANDAQVSLMEARPGEENENVLFEVRAKALRLFTKDQIEKTKYTVGWNSVGLGMARLLKHKQTGKTRLVMRAEPGANIILNTNLHKHVKYEYGAIGNAGSVKFNVITPEGIQGWTLKMKTQQLGQEMARLMEENKDVAT